MRKRAVIACVAGTAILFAGSLFWKAGGRRSESQSAITTIARESAASAENAAPAVSSEHPSSPITSTAVEWRWKLLRPVVTGPSRTAESTEGTLVTGFTLTADAKARGEMMPFRDGRLQLNLSAFKLTSDRPGVKAGRWYVHGQWTITDAHATLEQTRGRRNPRVIRGLVNTELPFNPFETRRAFNAAVNIPQALTSSRWYRGNGGLWVVGDDFGGEISIPVRIMSGAQRSS